MMASAEESSSTPSAAAWKSTLQHRSPEEYRTALRAEYSRLQQLREEELARESGATARPAQHGEHGAPAHTARPGGWKMWHSNDVAEDPASGMSAEEKFTCDRRASAHAAPPPPPPLQPGADPRVRGRHRSRFDLSGWFVRPSILTAEDIAAIREQVYLIKHDQEALPPHERRVPGGASSILIDHPKVVEVLDELYGGPDSARLEIAMAFWRERGERERAGADGLVQGWHQGGPELATSPVFGYHYKNGKMYPGMVRVIFELGEVSQTDGGTHFIGEPYNPRSEMTRPARHWCCSAMQAGSCHCWTDLAFVCAPAGSHKANFTMNPAFLRRSEEAILDLSAKHSPLIAGYDCPAGSAIFFTENLCQ
eukprot:SAG11_NODE_600_length_8259_cov_6.574510_11_plen_366_part_00